MSGVSAATMLSAGSLAIGAFGSISSAMAQQQQGNVARDVGNANAMALESQAQRIGNETRVRADIQRRENARKMGQTMAAYGASGVDVNSGTPLDVEADQATEGELQAKLIEYGGTSQQQQLMRQAQLLRMGGNAYGSAADIGAGSTLLTGGAKLAMAGVGLFGGSSGAIDPSGALRTKGDADLGGNGVRYRY